jgi:hypothetical protein
MDTASITIFVIAIIIVLVLALRAFGPGKR